MGKNIDDPYYMCTVMDAFDVRVVPILCVDCWHVNTVKEDSHNFLLDRRSVLFIIF